MFLLYNQSPAVLLLSALYPVYCTYPSNKDNTKEWVNSSTSLCRTFNKDTNVTIPVMAYGGQISYIPFHSISVAVLTIERLAWKRIVVISDVKWDKNLDSLAETLFEKDIQLIRFTLNTSDNACGTSEVVKYLKEQNRLNILLLSDTYCIRRLFELVDTWRNKCFYKHSHWLIVSQGETLDDVLPLGYCTHNVLVVQQLSEGNSHSCSFQYGKGRNANETTVKLLTVKVCNFTHYMKTVQEWRTEGDYPTSMDDIVSAEELYPNGEIGLDNIKLRVGVVPWPSYMTKRYVGNKTIYSGEAIDYLKQLARLLNFRYEIFEPPDGEFGRLVNDSWTGAIRMLLRKEIDLIGFPLSYQTKRQDVLDFVFPFWYETYLVYFRPLNESEARWSLLSDTFTWFSISIPIGLLFVLMFFATAESMLHRRFTFPTEVRVGEWLMSLTGILLKQGDVDIPMMAASKFLWAIWSYGCLILAAFLGANLMASLAVLHTRAPFNTLEELIANEEYTLGIPSGAFTELLLKNSTNEVYQKLWGKVLMSAKRYGMPPALDEKICNSSSCEFDVHMARLNSDKYAFVSDDVSVLGKCNISYIPESLGVIPAGFAFLKGSPYTDMFSQVTRWLHDTGIIDRMNKDKLRQMPKCSRTIKSVRKLDMSDLKSVFYILICLVSIAFLIFIMEIALFQIKCMLRRKG